MKEGGALKKKFKLLFFIAIFLWICYIIKTKVLDLLIDNFRMGRKIEKFEKKLRETSETSKDTPINLLTLASMFHDKMCDYEKALTQYQKIQIEFPDCDFMELVQYMIGECYEKMGRIELAIHEYKKYLELYPEGKHCSSLKEKLNSFETNGEEKKS